MDIHQLRAFRDELEKRAFGIPLVRTQDLTPAALAGLKRMGVKNPDGLDVSELAAQMNVDESTLYRGGMPSYTSSKKIAGLEKSAYYIGPFRVGKKRRQVSGDPDEITFEEVLKPGTKLSPEMKRRDAYARSLRKKAN